MTKTTASRRILLILVVTLIAAAGLVFEVVAANPVYADVREIGLEKTEDSDLWSDSDLTFIVYLEGMDFFNTNVGVRVDGEDQWLNPHDHYSCSYDLDTLEIVLKGDEIFKAVGECHLKISVSFKDRNYEEIAYGSNEVDVRESKYEGLLKDGNIFLGRDRRIGKKLNVWVQNKENLDGKVFDCEVTDLKDVSEGADKILSIESNEDGWTYKGLKCGEASLCMTFKDLKGNDHTHEFTVRVLDPDVSEYSLCVGDIPVTSENAANITGSDPVQASYDADSNTLTLNNYTYEGFGCDNDDVKAAIKARMENDFTIHLNGENTVKHVYEETSAGAGIYADNNMTITGEGTLTVSDGDNAESFNSRGIRVGKNVTIGSGATVNASSGKGQNSYGVNVKKLTVQGELNAAGGSAKKSYGVYTSDNVTVSKDGTLNADGGTATNGSYGVFIYNTSPSMTIEGAMTAKGNTFAIAKAADPNPSIDTAAIQYKNPEGYVATESTNYDGGSATPVAAGEKTSATAKYVRIIGSAPVTGVSLNKTSTSLAVGDSETLTAALKPEYALHPELVWESNDPSVATVSENGEVTAVAAGNATITVRATNGTDDTSDDKTATCDVTVKPTIKVTVPAGKTFTYSGKPQTGVAAGDNYTLTGITEAANAGTYTAKATLKTSTEYAYEWSDGTTAAKDIEWTINKATNPLKVKAKTAIVKFSAVKKKTQTLGVAKVIAVTNKGQGAKSYVKLSGNKKITIAKKTGKVTVKKGLKKGTYKVKVKVKAAGNANYKASAVKPVTITIKVK